jgi:hypothetical protein
MIELSLATGSCSLLCEEVTEKGEANIFNGESPTADRRMRNGGGERDKRDFVSPLPSPYFVLLVPNLPPPFAPAVIEPPKTKTANAFSGSFAVFGP